MKIYKFENGAIKGDLDGAGIKDAEKKYGRLLTVTEGHRIVPVFYGRDKATLTELEANYLNGITQGVV